MLSARPRRRWTRRAISCGARTRRATCSTLDGEPLTCERVKQAIGDVFTAHDMAADELIVSHGGQSAIGHEMGYGPISPGEPIVIDLWPQDRETGCHADMTRTYCVGEPPDELVEYHRLVKQALDEAIAGVRAGASGHELYRGTCELFHEHGYKTLLTKDLGETLEEGSSTASATASASRCTRIRAWGSRPASPLVAGDVVTVEPGLYRPRLRRLPPRGPRARHGGRLREPHGLPVRPDAVTEGIETLLHEERRYAAVRRSSRRRRTRSRGSTTCRSRSSGRARRASA